jgi:hypothetical protein
MQQLLEAAKYGIAGEVVRLVGPYTEADPAAILVQLLSALGNYAGPFTKLRIGELRHPARLNVILVGATSKARKGTSWGLVERFLDAADEKYLLKCMVNGAASGEGLIACFTNNKSEKRRFLIEEEFSAVLAKMRIDTSTLSQVIRQSFDRERLSVTTRNKPLFANGAHLSVVGHITAEELSERLQQVEIHNGFANRFLWIRAERSRPQAITEEIPLNQKKAVVDDLQRSLTSIKVQRDVSLADDSKEYWVHLYNDLSEDAEGDECSKFLDRAEAIIPRIALIYALGDGADAIRVPHLEAAYALWQYSCRCVETLFGGEQLSSSAKRVLSVLTYEWQAKTVVTDLLGRHIYGEKLTSAIKELVSHDIAETMLEDTGGRKRTLVRRIRIEQSEVSESS